MAYQIQVENIKCGGCANTIRTKISELDGIDSVDVDIAEGTVSIAGSDDTRTAAIAKLLKLGYPESGTAEGMAAAKAKAKSFVSCAVGRMSGEG
jgi:copper chaperone